MFDSPDRPTDVRRGPGGDARGFALVSVLILLVALTALATGGFLVSNSELDISRYHTAGSRAFHTADAAMHDHLGTVRRGARTDAYSYASGNATVTGQLLLDLGDGNELFQMSSTATHLPAGGGTASRSIGLIAMINDAGFRANAAVTAGSGLHKNGASGALDGVDQASASDCSAGTQADVAGVATGPGLYTQNGSNPVPTGSPPIDDTQSGYQQLADLNLDWQGIVNGTVITPDVTLPGGGTWPNFNTIAPDHWPVIYVDQPTFTPLGAGGRGTLIVRNDLVLNGNWTWDGIILVGGQFTSDGKQTVEGTIVTALNMLLPGNPPVPPSSVGNGNKSFRYHSCWIRLAAQQFVGGLVPMPGTWSEDL